MPETLIVTSRKGDLRGLSPEDVCPGAVWANARDYIRGTHPLARDRSVHVISLCASKDYLSLGYYVSLLAEARRQKVVPPVQTLIDLNWKRIYERTLPELSDEADKAIGKEKDNLPDGQFTIEVYFGRTADRRFAALAKRAYTLFRYPILELAIAPSKKGWRVRYVWPLSPAEVDPPDFPAFVEALQDFARRRWNAPRGKTPPRYDLAMLWNPNEELPPSDERALRRFEQAGEEVGIHVERVTKDDFDKLTRFDALFVRETTRIDDHTFRFARRAHQERMPVIDDPVSILRCTNKVFLADVLAAARISSPKTLIVDTGGLREVDGKISYPIVLKIPDGSFSRGVFKVGDRAELEARAKDLFEDSDVILAQEYVYTPYDWRIGVLAGKPLFACQYFMSRGHWQIYNHQGDGSTTSGKWKTWPIEAAPAHVVETAVKAASLIGDGLYGVDLKEKNGKVYIIEINDNPSIESGVEDQVAKDGLYLAIMKTFLERLDQRRGG